MADRAIEKAIMKPPASEPPRSGGPGQVPRPSSLRPRPACGAADRFLLEGPRSRTSEFVQLLRVMRDFLRGFRVLHFVGPCVTAFGSARTKEDSPYYQLARQMGAAVARIGFTVMTGGGPGIMEAANRGASEARGLNGGLTISIPDEEFDNAG